MTTPPDDGREPDAHAHGTRRALENYPEFFTYPARSETGARPHIPAARAEAPMAAAPGAPAGPESPVAADAPEFPDRIPSRERVTGAEPQSPSQPEGVTFAAAFGNLREASGPPASSLPSPLASPSPTSSPSTSASDFPGEPEPPPPPRRDRTGSTGRTANTGSSSSGGRCPRRAKRSLAASLWPFHAMRRPAAAPSKRIRSRSTAATVWRKLKADRAAVFGGCTIVVLVLLAIFAPVVTGLFGVDPDSPHPELTDATFGPHGSFGGMSWSHPLGVDQRMGRDVMARLLFGARVSLLIAFGATVLSVSLGSALGVLSGYLGGRVDAVVMRTADVFLAFPLMLFALGLTGALSDEAFGLSGNALRIAVMIFVMGFFNWPYIARIVRAEVLSLREREFVDAARALGARTGWVVWRELTPNLMAPILVYTTLLIPANIIFEAGLSALGIGLNPPTASWGQMMTDAISTVYTDPAYLIVPGMAVFITVLAFNLFGDGLRDALDPTAR